MELNEKVDLLVKFGIDGVTEAYNCLFLMPSNIQVNNMYPCPAIYYSEPCGCPAARVCLYLVWGKYEENKT